MSFNPQDYQIQDQIKQGNFAIVFKGHHKITKKQIAVKCIYRNQLKKKYLQRQIQVIQNIEHPHVVKLIGCQYLQSQIRIYMQLCDMDLSQLIQLQYSHGKSFTQEQSLVLLMPVFDALLQLFLQKQLLHRDLKPMNILLKNGRSKLTDFGISKFMVQGQKNTVFIGTPQYMSPELRELNSYYTEKCDVYSFGCVMYELVHYKMACKMIKNDQINIERSDLTPQFVNFLKCCLQKKQQNRKTWRQLNKHPLIINYRKNIQQTCRQSQIVLQIYKMYHQHPINQIKRIQSQQFDKINKDKQKIIQCYIRSAKQGISHGQYKLGLCYFLGQGVKQNKQKAFQLFYKAARQGHLSAQYKLGQCYFNGYGTIQNKQQAIKWFIYCAEQGSSDGQYKLSQCYFNGDGIQQNKQKGVQLLIKLANQENLYGEYKLGQCYLYGNGIEKNLQKAVQLFIKSAEKGNQQAKYKLKQLKIKY